VRELVPCCPCDHAPCYGDRCFSCACHGSALDLTAGRADSAADLRAQYGRGRSAFDDLERAPRRGEVAWIGDVSFVLRALATDGGEARIKVAANHIVLEIERISLYPQDICQVIDTYRDDLHDSEFDPADPLREIWMVKDMQQPGSMRCEQLILTRADGGPIAVEFLMYDAWQDPAMASSPQTYTSIQLDVYQIYGTTPDGLTGPIASKRKAIRRQAGIALDLWTPTGSGRPYRIIRFVPTDVT